MLKKTYQKILLGTASVLVLFGGFGIFAASYIKKEATQPPLIFSPNAMLHEMWSDYKGKYLEKDTFRTIDRQSGDITTSEGQSYSMLRSVWMDDRETFDKSWQWTKDNLQRDDKLFAWKFGKTSSGEYSVLAEQGGQNTAADGDSDIALSLLMAYSRWNEQDYLSDAKPIIEAIWEKEVVLVQGKPVLVANDLERNSLNTMIVNPSYFSPYAYKVFAFVDKQHDWNGLADHSYELLNAISSNPLDTGRSTSLPPDWVLIDYRTGALSAPAKPLTTKYSYDALRTPWRLAIDWLWFQDERAKNTLSTYGFLGDTWQKEKQLKAEYSHDGQIVGNYESAAMYGGAIGYFSVIKPDLAKEVYEQKLLAAYDPDTQANTDELGYYDTNWAWFGLALYHNALPNLTKTEG